MKTLPLLVISAIGILAALICGAGATWYVLGAIIKLVTLHPVAAFGRLVWGVVLAGATWLGWQVATRSLNAVGAED